MECQVWYYQHYYKKWPLDWRYSSVVELLPSMHDFLGLMLNTTQTKKYLNKEIGYMSLLRWGRPRPSASGLAEHLRSFCFLSTATGQALKKKKHIKQHSLTGRKWHTPLIPLLGRQRQVGRCEFEGQPGLQSKQDPGQLGLYREILSQKTPNNNKATTKHHLFWRAGSGLKSA